MILTVIKRKLPDLLASFGLFMFYFGPGVVGSAILFEAVRRWGAGAVLAGWVSGALMFWTIFLTLIMIFTSEEDWKRSRGA